jgi:hypothetical protein
LFLHRLFGLVVGAARQLPAPPATGTPDIVIHEHAGRQLATIPPSSFGYSYHVLANGCVRVSWSDLFDFEVSADGARIDVHTGAQSDAEPAYTYLISQVISVALLKRGVESLHASAVAHDGKATVLLGESGRGKSTLTAALLQQGAKLITDDLLVLRFDGGDYLAVPGAFRIKLEPATARQLDVTWTGTPLADGSGKYVYRLDAAQCMVEDTRVERIVVLESNAVETRTETLSTTAATRALLEATFNPLHTEPSRLAALLNEARMLAASVPVVRLHVPRDFAQLPTVIAELMKWASDISRPADRAV